MGWERSLKKVEYFGTPETIFLHSRKEWECVEVIGSVVCDAFRRWKDYSPKVQKQIQRMDQYMIMPVFFGSPHYPKPLTFCTDAPLVLFQKENCLLKTGQY
ncbi:MAG: hypothetical protein ACO3UL_01665 [Flavobacteriaceae bacterium]